MIFKIEFDLQLLVKIPLKFEIITNHFFKIKVHHTFIKNHLESFVYFVKLYFNVQN
jgi:hypothetical protein